MMSLEQKVEQHGKRLDEHDRELKQLSNQINENLIRVDENNKFLREQNGKILEAVIHRNDKADERNHELKKVKQENMWKFILMISGASGLITYILNLFFNK